MWLHPIPSLLRKLSPGWWPVTYHVSRVISFFSADLRMFCFATLAGSGYRPLSISILCWGNNLVG